MKVKNIEIDIDILKEQLNNRTNMFVRGRSYNSRMNGYIGLTITAASILATVLIGLSEIFDELDEYLSALALIFSATVSGIHIWQNRFQKNLMLYADGAQELWQLKRDLQHIEKMADESREEVLKSFYFEFRKTVDELHEQWEKTSSDSSEE